MHRNLFIPFWCFHPVVIPWSPRKSSDGELLTFWERFISLSFSYKRGFDNALRYFAYWLMTFESFGWSWLSFATSLTVIHPMSLNILLWDARMISLSYTSLILRSEKSNSMKTQNVCMDLLILLWILLCDVTLFLVLLFYCSWAAEPFSLIQVVKSIQVFNLWNLQ